MFFVKIYGYIFKTSSNCHESNNGSTEQKGNVKHQSTHRHRHHVRIRHSKNQNKMIEPQQVSLLF